MKKMIMPSPFKKQKTVSYLVHLVHKLKSYRISGRVCGLISSFLSNRQLLVVLDGIFLQEYPANAVDAQGSFFGPILFVQFINDLPDYAQDFS